MTNFGEDIMSQRKTLKLQTTRVFQDLLNPNYRNYVFQGSSRAGKTYNIILWMVINILNEENKVYSIVRKTLPSLKGSVLRDLKDILLKLDLYDSNKWHSVDGYVEIGSNIIEFFSLDSEEKVRGRKRDICFINEATEISYDEYVQLSLRTSERMILDFNPSLWQSWLYDLEKQEDTVFSELSICILWGQAERFALLHFGFLSFFLIVSISTIYTCC